jgi:hypothetical protein
MPSMGAPALLIKGVNLCPLELIPEAYLFHVLTLDTIPVTLA